MNKELVPNINIMVVWHIFITTTENNDLKMAVKLHFLITHLQTIITSGFPKIAIIE